MTRSSECRGVPKGSHWCRNRRVPLRGLRVLNNAAHLEGLELASHLDDDAYQATLLSPGSQSLEEKKSFVFFQNSCKEICGITLESESWSTVLCGGGMR